jgi:spore maturation protein SpmA
MAKQKKKNDEERNSYLVINHTGIFIFAYTIEIALQKGHCRTERVVLSTIIYTCIVSFVQVHDENKYTEVGYIGYEFNIYNSCCLWVVRRSQ